MAVDAGGGYSVVEDWEQLPEGMAHRDVADVAVGPDDRVYLLTRYDANVIVYEQDGSYVRHWGDDVLSERPHAITVGPDETVYVVDELTHSVTAYDAEGKRLFDVGPSGVPSDTGADPEIPDIYDRIATIQRGAGPFNRPTKVAIAPDGTLVVSDGYGNARVHRFSATGDLLGSFGEPGGGPGQFHLPHSVAVRPDGVIYVADRENDRVQLFDPEGQFIAEWLDLHRPASLGIHGDHVFVGELTQRPGYRSWRNGTIDEVKSSRVAVFDLDGAELARIGRPEALSVGGFTAPHGLAVDSRGDLYVAEVSFSDGGRKGIYPEDCHTFVKLTGVMSAAPSAAAGVAVAADLDGLAAFAAAALRATGMRDDDAEVGADVLVRTAARGQETHGVAYLHSYVNQLQQGGADPRARLVVVRETPATAVVDARDGNGLVATVQATRMAIDKAREVGSATVLVRGSNHFGAAGHYALLAAEEGLIGQVTSNSNPVMAAAGSRSRAIGNGVTAYGIPMRSAPPVVLDIALSVVAGGKLRMAERRGESVPPGLFLAPDGSPGTDPAEFMRGGALLPMGGHKGYGLAVFGEVMGGVLSGARFGQEVQSWLRAPDVPAGIGHMVTVQDVGAFAEPAEFYDRMDAFVAELHGAPRLDGVDRILLPGEIEHELEARARRDGLELEPAVWSTLVDLADRLGLSAELAASVRPEAPA